MKYFLTRSHDPFISGKKQTAQIFHIVYWRASRYIFLKGLDISFSLSTVILSCHSCIKPSVLTN